MEVQSPRRELVVSSARRGGGPPRARKRDRRLLPRPRRRARGSPRPSKGPRPRRARRIWPRVEGAPGATPHGRHPDRHENAYAARWAPPCRGTTSTSTSSAARRRPDDQRRHGRNPGRRRGRGAPEALHRLWEWNGPPGRHRLASSPTKTKSSRTWITCSITVSRRVAGGGAMFMGPAAASPIARHPHRPRGR